ncbi:MAG: hypothetical protein LBI82_06220 [Dysgonamonadaceae bacterium]|jgi:tetratricopeptide (TPR) repeat protein|nr:hypothetical protein [Dysgonamonadaceae bacterium]
MMKKLSLTIVLCLTVALSFGQKKAVADVKREIGNAKPNIEDARNLIKGAMQDPETMDNAETWFVAGKVEDKQFSMEQQKELLGQTPDELVMYSALQRIKPFFLVADSLDQLPDAKGKVKPKFRKDMKSILLANRLHYLNAGGFFYNKGDYENAFDMFNQFFSMPKMNMFEGENIAVNDTAYAQFRYYAGLALAQFSTDTTKIISYFESIKNNNGYNEEDVLKFLSSLYEQTNNTVGMVNTLREGVERFPNDSFFMLSLINHYIYSDQGDAAIKMITKAIELSPNNAELYNVLGIVFENSKKDNDAAKANYEKALSIDPNYVEAIGNLGRIFYNRAVEAQVAANEISDNKKYEAARAQAMDMFREALPFFERAHQLRPEDRDYMIALSRIYYVLNMGDKYDEIDAKLNQ